MRYDTAKELSCEDFRRLTGVRPKTFGAMLGVLHLAEEKKHEQGGSSHVRLKKDTKAVLANPAQERCLCSSRALSSSKPYEFG